MANELTTFANDKTCYKCKHYTICHANRVMERLLAVWPIDIDSTMGDINTWQFLYNVLACVCLKFEKAEIQHLEFDSEMTLDELRNCHSKTVLGDEDDGQNIT